MEDLTREELLKRTLAAKEKRRIELARLPIEEKWLIVLSLQKRVLTSRSQQANKI
jgi:hypothetical protein